MFSTAWDHRLLRVTCLILISLLTSVQGCVKSAMYYRSTVRGRSHAFVRNEYQPALWEDSTEASGPLSAHDVHYNLPSKRLVRVDSPDIVFASEQARWMTIGCQDRLLKLSTQIQNVWVNQGVVLKVIRAWVKPPLNYQFPYNQPQESPENSNNFLFYGPGDGVSNRPVQQTGLHSYRSSHSTLRQGGLRDRTEQKQQGVPPSGIGPLRPDMLAGEEDRKGARSSKTLDSQSLTLLPSNQAASKQYYSPHERRPSSYYFTSGRSNFYQPWTPARNIRQPLRSSADERPYVMYKDLERSLSSRQSQELGDSNFRQLSTGDGVGVIRLPRTAVSSPRDNAAPSSSTVNNSVTGGQRLTRKVSRSVKMMRVPQTMNGFTMPRVNSMQKDVRLEEMLDIQMEDFHYAGRAVDMELVRPNFALPINDNRNLGVLAQMAYYVAQFDWCYFTPYGHIHCSVKPDASITSQWFGCFPGSALVQRDSGQEIPIHWLQVGDKVTSLDPASGKRIATTVTAFLHYDAHAWSPMWRISYVELKPTTQPMTEGSLTLTPDHLVYHVDQRVPPMRLEAVFAASLQPNNTIMISTNSSQTMVLARVLQVTPIIGASADGSSLSPVGLYAPLTDSGTLLVDGVLVSCFSYYYSHDLAYWVTWPITILHKLRSLVLHSSTLSRAQQHTGIHWYTQYLLENLSPWLPSSFFSSSSSSVH